MTLFGRELNTRESILIGALALILVLFLAQRFLLQPIREEITNLRATVPSRGEQLQQLLREVPRALSVDEQKQQRIPADSVPLALVEDAAMASGIREQLVQSNDLSDQRGVAVVFSRADFSRWVQWYQALESQGFFLREGRVAATRQPGIIDARLTFGYNR
ncbi:type II secretion system protein GspM [Gammaproteobacteria bacterium]|nr:type II secretion system protein GspM [Gammaproteobacteria bacterium]